MPQLQEIRPTCHPLQPSPTTITTTNPKHPFQRLFSYHIYILTDGCQYRAHTTNEWSLSEEEEDGSGIYALPPIAAVPERSYCGLLRLSPDFASRVGLLMVSHLGIIWPFLNCLCTICLNARILCSNQRLSESWLINYPTFSQFQADLKMALSIVITLFEK